MAELKLLTPDEIAAIRNSYNDAFPYTAREFNARRAIAKAELTAREQFEWLEKYVFYMDRQGYIALRPNATEHWQQLRKQIEGEG